MSAAEVFSSVALAALAPLLVVAAGARALRRPGDPLYGVLAGFVLAASGVTALIIALGSAGTLSRGPFLIGAATLGACAVWFLRAPPKDDPAPPEAVPDAAPPNGGGRRSERLLRDGTVVFVALLAALTIGWIAFEAWRRPPLAYDALMYHLVFPAEWIRGHALTLVPTVFAAPANSYFPCNSEAVVAYVMLAAGDERLAGLRQLPFLLAGGAALAGIAARCGLPRWCAGLCGLLFAAMPEAASQAGSALADVGFAATALWAVYFILDFSATGSRLSAALAGGSVGLMAGTKSLGLPFAALLLMPAVAALRRQRDRGARALLGDAAVAAICAVPLGAFWYARNWEITGNPLFPLEIAPGGAVLFTGAHGRAEMLQSHFHVPPAAAALNALARLLGPAHDLSGATGFPLHAPFLLLLLLAALPFGLPRLLSARSARGPAGAVVCLPVLMLLVFAAINPYNTQYRFLLAGAALSLLPLGAAAARPGGAGSVFTLGFAVAAADLLVFWGVADPRAEVFRLPWVPMLAVALAGALAAVVRRAGARVHLPGRPRLPGPRALVAAGALCGALAVAALASAQPAFRLSYGGFTGGSVDGQRAAAWAFVRSLPSPRVVAYTGFNQPYPLYGAELRNSVTYVAVDGRQGWNLHDYLQILGPSSGLVARRSYKPAYERQQPSQAKWLAGIAAMHVDTLVVSRFTPWDRTEYNHDGRGFPWEDGWARSRPDLFRLLLDTGDIHVYEVVRGT